MKNTIQLTIALLLIFIFQVHRVGAQGSPGIALVNRNAEKSQAAAPGPALARLGQLANERLVYMKDVAAYKWVNRLPTEDLAREQLVLKNSMTSAEKYQLDPISTRQFFEQQIALAKTIQRYWFGQWERKGFEKYAYKDLNTVVRPALLSLGDEILRALHDLAPWALSDLARQEGMPLFIIELTTAGLRPEDKQALYESVMAISEIAEVDKDAIYQVSRLDFLSEGQYDGITTYGALKKYGDFGLGTFEAVDGEMIGLDGLFYQVKTDGVAYSVSRGLKTPFANVTWFEADETITIDKPMTLAELQAYLESRIKGLEGYYAIRVDGQFEYVKTRSVHVQQEPYPPLADVIAQQVTFEFEQIKGTMVGFRFPEAAAGENVTGFHFHFLTGNREAGGHLLDCRIQKGTVAIDHSSGIGRVDKPESIEGKSDK